MQTIRTLTFELPIMAKIGLPLVAVALLLYGWRCRRHGVSRRRTNWSGLLRGLVLLILLFLAARPVWVERLSAARTSVLLLVDRSASMSVQDEGRTRLRAATAFARDTLLTALSGNGLTTRAFLFDEVVVETDGVGLVQASPDGHRTDLSGAILEVLAQAREPPLAVIALTDGAANVPDRDRQAANALLATGAPFLAVGFNGLGGVETLALRHAVAPGTVPRNQKFQVSARVEYTGAGSAPSFTLLLLRDGQLLQHKTVSPGVGPRLWLEGFSVEEGREGAYVYSLQIQPPPVASLKCVDGVASAKVHVTGGDADRVLFFQGAPGWDYKFIRLALKDDPVLKVTGLTRTSEQTFLRQHVEGPGELKGGFPSTLEELAPFRVVILSGCTPAELRPEQQDMLLRFCREFGGGVLIMGGAETFNASWAHAPLKSLLPVSLDTSPNPGFATSYRLHLTDAARGHSVFRIDDRPEPWAGWAGLPDFSRYAGSYAPKRGATVWAEHPSARGRDGRPHILMALQRFGTGLAMVVCTPDFWSWRLSGEAEARHYDRFWRQLLRFLSEGGGGDLMIHLAGEELRPLRDIHCVVERRRDPADPDAPRRYAVSVVASQTNTVMEQSVEIMGGQSVDVTFQVPTAGLYSVEAIDAGPFPVASRSFDVRDQDLEYRNRQRDMGQLRDWAGLSGGVAARAEHSEEVEQLIKHLARAVDRDRMPQALAVPAGLSKPVLGVLLIGLCFEWVLRKRWGLR